MENSFIVRDNFLMVDIRRECNNIILVLSRDIKPILKTLEIWDVAHIKECLESECADLSFIYSAAVRATGEERLRTIEERAGHDIWEPLRGECQARSPLSAGFVFRDNPLLRCSSMKDKALRCLLVNEEGALSIDNDAVTRESIVEPCAEDVELYRTVAEFCEKLNSMNHNRRRFRELFSFTDSEDFIPNKLGIFYGGGVNPVRYTFEPCQNATSF